MLLGIEISIGIVCPNCNTRNPLPGFRTDLSCYNCQENIPVKKIVDDNYDAGLKYQFGGYYDIMKECIALREEGEKGHVNPGHTYSFQYKRSFPSCPNCNHAFTEENFSDGNDFFCPDCKNFISVRPGGKQLSQWDGRIKYVVNDPGEGKNLAANKKTEPAGVVIACMTCSAALQVDGSTRMVKCEHCSNTNYLPDGLWLSLHPVPKRQVFWILYEFDEIEILDTISYFLSSEEEGRKNNAYHYPEFQEEAAQKKLQNQFQERIEKLAEDPEYLQKKINSKASGHIEKILFRIAIHKKKLSTSQMISLLSHPDVQIPVVLLSYPELPDEFLSAAAKTNIAEIQMQSCYHPKLKDAEILLLAKDPKPMVKIAVCSRKNLNPEIFEILSKDESPLVRRVVAIHANVPGEILKVLRSDKDAETAKIAKSNPNYQPGFFKRLFGG